MLLKAIGVLMMLDGVLSAMASLPMLDSIVYRSLRDQSLLAAHFLVGALLLLSGRLLLAQKRDRDSFRGNESRSRFPAATLVAALVVSGLEVTRFDWPVFAARCAYTLAAIAVLIWSKK